MLLITSTADLLHTMAVRLNRCLLSLVGSCKGIISGRSGMLCLLQLISRMFACICTPNAASYWGFAVPRSQKEAQDANELFRRCGLVFSAEVRSGSECTSVALSVQAAAIQSCTSSRQTQTWLNSIRSPKEDLAERPSPEPC